MSEKNKNQENEFPCEITFKAVYYSKSSLVDSIKSCLAEHELDYNLTDKISVNGKFISFTITATFNSEEILNNICKALKSISGYKMMF